MTTRAAIYARVSSAGQRERHTIENQLRTLPAFVEAQGWKLAGTYVDDGRSAKTGALDKREGFAQLLVAAERKKFDVLAIVDVDRLTRTDSIEERARILGPFQRLGIRIVSPTGGELDLQTMFGEVSALFQALGAAQERKKLIERIKAGKLRAIAEGRKPAGPTPFGLTYHRPTGAWSIDEEAAAIVREIFTRVASGQSCVRIADDLAARNVRGPKKGWTRAAVYRTMHTRYACGEWCVDKVRGVILAVPRLVSDELWFAAQRALRSSQRSGLDRTIHVYLLQGIARCTCGEPIVIRSGVKYYNAAREPREHPAAYHCRGRTAKPRTCEQPIAHSHPLDERVWAALIAELEQPDLITALAETAVRKANDVHDWAGDAEGYRARLSRLDKHEADMYRRLRLGQVSPGAWDIERPAIERERKMVREQLETAIKAMGSIASSQARLRSASSTVERLRSALPRATPEQRRALLRELVRDGGVIIDQGRARLDLRLIRSESAESHDAHVGEPTLAVVPGSSCSSIYGASLRLRLVA